MKKSSNSIKHGDVFVLGQHLLLAGDCTNKEQVSKVMGNKKVKAVVIDPPYGIALTESKRDFNPLSKDKVILNDHIQSDSEYIEFSKKWIEAILPHMDKKNSFYIFNSDKMIFALREAMIDSGLKFAQLLIWVKTHAIIGRMDYAPQHELIAFGWFGTHKFFKGKDKSVLICPKSNKSPYHPSTKPRDLIRRLILNSTRIGDVVYDGFLGSGTTLLACEQTKRICIGVEYDLEYCQTIIDRFEKLTGIKAEKI